MRSKTKQNGSIALITVIILMGILLAVGTVVVLTVADLAIAANSFSSRFRLEGTVRTCLEESLFRVKSDPEFTGEVSYANSGDSCTALVEIDLIDEDLRTISITGLINGFSLQKTFTVDVSVQPFQILN